MGYLSDARAVTTTSGSASISGRVRLTGLYFTSKASSAMTFLNGSAGGAHLLTISSSGGASGSETLNIPNQGILFSDGILVTATTAGNIPSLTIFYEA